MSEKGNPPQSRSRIRFNPDPLAFALIDSQNGGGSTFSPDLVALIVDEAPFGGCGLALVDNQLLKTGTLCRVKVGHIAPLKAEVVWRRDLDAQVVRVGLKFLE